jgi:hypothetical protein
MLALAEQKSAAVEIKTEPEPKAEVIAEEITNTDVGNSQRFVKFASEKVRVW